MFGRISRSEFDKLKERFDWLELTHKRRAPRRFKDYPLFGTACLDIAAKRDLDALMDKHVALEKKHQACVTEFTAKLQAICPHADTTLEETEDFKHTRYSHAPQVYYNPASYCDRAYDVVSVLYGRRTVETCDVCGKVLEDKFEEYVDQPLPIEPKYLIGKYNIGVDVACR